MCWSGVLKKWALKWDVGGAGGIAKYGGTKHAGFGLGFERAIMYLTGMGNIGDVIAFPERSARRSFK